jgi:hypothetical protein
MSGGFVKLYGTILDSSIWGEPLSVRIVWISLLAMADRDGLVAASSDGIARRANVPLKQTDNALDVLSNPDPRSKSDDHEGRRVQRVDGGWQILNYAKYRELRTDKQIADAERIREKRERGEYDARGPVLPCRPDATRSNVAPEAEAEAKADTEADTKTEEKPPRVVFPKEATEFLTLFYEGPAMTEAARKRYANVKSQLYDVIDPLHRGVVIRGGQRVKARSVEHLIDECNFLINNPPPDRDLAIVWLLKRLTNPPKGPTVTEVVKRNQEAERNREEQYRLAAKRAGGRWAKEHPDEFAKIVAAVDANLHGASGAWVKVARETALTQRTAEAAGFPSIEEWEQTRGAA